MPDLTLTRGHQAAEWFNLTHPIGTEVVAFPGTKEGRALQRKTRSAAWVLGSDTPVVAIEGYAGGIALSHVVCAQHATHDPDAPDVRDEQREGPVTTPGWLTSWPTPTWPHIDYAEHATEEAAHRHALVKSREIAGEVAVIPMAQFDTTRKRATR